MTPHPTDHPEASKLDRSTLRVICAEEVGWKDLRWNRRILMGVRPGETILLPQAACLTIPEPRLTISVAPAFESDANAALLLCEEMAKRGWGKEWTTDALTGNEYFVFRRYKDGLEQHGGTAPTLPLAIARAFAIATGRAK